MEAQPGYNPGGILRRERIEVVFPGGGVELDNDAQLGDPELVVDLRSDEFGFQLNDMGSTDTDISQLERLRRPGQRQAVAVDGLIVGGGDGHMDTVVSRSAGGVADLQHVRCGEGNAGGSGQERQCGEGKAEK